MIKLMLLYGFPADPEAFEEHHADVYRPLLEQMPGADRWETARVMDTMEGIPTYHRIDEFWFESYDRLEVALGSPEGQAVVADIPNFATGGLLSLSWRFKLAVRSPGKLPMPRRPPKGRLRSWAWTSLRLRAPALKVASPSRT